jgi:hypothetical protein
LDAILKEKVLSNLSSSSLRESLEGILLISRQFKECEATQAIMEGFTLLTSDDEELDKKYEGLLQKLRPRSCSSSSDQTGPRKQGVKVGKNDMALSDTFRISAVRKSMNHAGQENQAAAWMSSSARSLELEMPEVSSLDMRDNQSEEIKSNMNMLLKIKFGQEGKQDKEHKVDVIVTIHSDKRADKADGHAERNLRQQAHFQAAAAFPETNHIETSPEHRNRTPVLFNQQTSGRCGKVQEEPAPESDGLGSQPDVL